ncbi:hypothetical protein [Carboxydothermus ferrireducens]|uniref:DNA polymerase-3 subunit delta n=1 Tax=Carboxydothermus ferrireducens DSM 11255 TaxID=1119529 RepID=A0ABX2RCF2_9THEO|nr:hypothetical protein [Carboxydothermus ferrireducens]NYE57550.1 DNA polymerase-3 subunit delta' [Carboxydothermus ferrireducens DSM 11255]
MDNLIIEALNQDKLSHAYLLTSPVLEVVVDFARRTAREILIKSANDPVEAANLFEAGTHPDFLWLAPDGSSFKIWQVNEVLIPKVYLTPQKGSRKVIVLEEVDKMTLDAANAFLKTLEEPPAGVTYLLIATMPEKVLPTIHSRCQKVKVSAEDFTGQYKGYAEKFYELLTLPWEEFYKKTEKITREELNNLLLAGELILRDALIVDKGSEKLFYPDLFDKAQELNRLGEGEIYRLLNRLEEFLAKTRLNLNPRLVLENLYLNFSFYK